MNLFQTIERLATPELLFRFGLEACVLIAAVWFIYFKSGIDRLFSALPRVSRVIVKSFFALWCLVQLVDRLQYHFPPALSFFPIARFAMYQTGSVQDPVKTYQLEGRYLNDERREINFTRLFQVIGLPPIDSRFRWIREQLGNPSSERARQRARRDVELLVEAVRRRLRARNEEVPEQICLLELATPLYGDSRDEAVSRVLFCEGSSA